MSQTKSTPAVTATIQTSRLQQFVRAVKPVSDEFVLTFDENGMHTEVVDSANVVMADVSISWGGFQNCDWRTTKVGVGTGQFRAFLNRGPSRARQNPPSVLEDTTTLTVDLEDKQLSLESGPVTQTVSVMDAGDLRPEPDLPELDLSATVELNERLFHGAVAQMDELDDNLFVGYEPAEETLYLEAHHDEETFGRVEFTVEEDSIRVIESGLARSAMTTDYLIDFARSIRDRATVTLEAGEEFPIIASYRFAGGNGEATFMQAPRLK